ncbi:hypothetical protein A2U01_0096034, partial [Trifolium medium]|nr:hypothetical protein [Trifolium medium]
PQQHWAYPWTPPCQYSTTGAPHHQSGILGPKPQQVHMATGPPHINSEQSSYAPTGILAAKHTFSISPPDDQ